MVFKEEAADFVLTLVPEALYSTIILVRLKSEN